MAPFILVVKARFTTFSFLLFWFLKIEKVEKSRLGPKLKSARAYFFFYFFLQDLVFSTFRLAAVLDEERAHRRVAGLPFRLPDGLHE